MASDGRADTEPIIRRRVLVMPYPLHGHIAPLLQLSKLLAARAGFSITFVTNHFNVRRILHSKQQVGDPEAQMGIDIVGISDGIYDDRDPHETQQQPVEFRKSLSNLHASFEELVGKMVAEAADAAAAGEEEQEQEHIACIISDSFLLWAQDVANKWCIPRVSFWPQSLTCFACARYVHSIMAAYPNFDPFTPEVYESVHNNDGGLSITCIPGIPKIHACKLPFYTFGGKYQESIRHDVCTQVKHDNEALCIISNSFPALESELLLYQSNKPMLPLGPLLPSTFLGDARVNNEAADITIGLSTFDEDDECLQWLNKQKHGSVLYMSMGSVLVLQANDIREICLGLEACKQPFLWVLKEMPLVVGHDKNIEPILAWLVKSGQGKVMKWAPQLRVLAHEAVGGFFTHCGWNSTLETICMGVPVIGWPQMLDQLTNCWFLVEKLRMGIELMNHHHKDSNVPVRHEDVERAVRMLMQTEEGHSMRMRALQLHDTAKSSYSSISSNLDTFIQTIVSANALEGRA